MLRATALLVTALLACKGESVESSSTQSDASNEATVDASDASVSDAAVAETSVAELLKNGGFELGCAGWSAYGGTAEESAVAHGGTKSCRVCSDSDAYDFGVRQDLPGGPRIGKTYVGEVWVRTTPDDAGVPATPSATLITWAASTATVEDDVGSPLPLDSTWRRATTLLTVTKSAVSISFGMQGFGGSKCFLIDDASVHIAP